MEGSKKEVTQPFVGEAGRDTVLKIDILDRETFHYVRIVGEIDIHTGVAFQTEMQELIQVLHLEREGRAEGPIQVILDLSEGFADGSGIRNLMEAVRFAEACQFAVRFVDCRAVRHMVRFMSLPPASVVPMADLSSI